MRTYRLKDKEAFEQLRKITPDFAERLQDRCARELDEDGVEVTLYIRRGDLEIKDIYNPNWWNTWPEVTPPLNVFMRCERKHDDYIERYSAKFDGMEWRSSSGDLEPCPDHFRPWD